MKLNMKRLIAMGLALALVMSSLTPSYASAAKKNDDIADVKIEAEVVEATTTEVTADADVNNAAGKYQVVKVETTTAFPQVLYYLAHQSAGIINKEQAEEYNSKFTVEEYDPSYHEHFKTYVSEDKEIYTLFEDGDFGKEIPMSKLSFMGNGEIFDTFFSVCSKGVKPIKFRKDAVAVL